MSLHRTSWPWRTLVGALFVVALVHGARVRGHQSALASQRTSRPPPPLGADDADHDGLPDALEAALAAKFAPVIVLDPQDHNRPASIPWLLANFGGPESGQDGFPPRLRPGSSDRRDWVTYVHVYPRRDGDINVQFWFFYAFNESAPFFDHDSDWEHVTVVVDRAGSPRGVIFAQHRNSSPGVFRDWSGLRREGDHPIVLSARGTHASYPDQESLPWFESASRCVRLEGCSDPIWRTWEAGGLLNVGERRAVLGPPSVRDALTFGGRWGAAGHFPRSSGAPYGPPHQSGFVVDGFEQESFVTTRVAAAR